MKVRIKHAIKEAQKREHTMWGHRKPQSIDDKYAGKKIKHEVLPSRYKGESMHNMTRRELEYLSGLDDWSK